MANMHCHTKSKEPITKALSSFPLKYLKHGIYCLHRDKLWSNSIFEYKLVEYLTEESKTTPSFSFIFGTFVVHLRSMFFLLALVGLHAKSILLF